MTITTEMDQKIGTRPVLRVQITTSGATTDVTSYLKSCGALEMEKSRTGENALVSAGDMMFVFSNHDDKFTELDSGSIFYGVTYIGKNIDIDFGFKKDDGTTEYEHQGVFKIIEVYLSSNNSQCYISARDNIGKLNKFVLNVPANAIVPIANTSNVGNGYITEIATKPFGTVTENWTLTCTTLGGAGVAIFSVVGSVSGDIGDATSNTEFSTGNIIKFTIFAGATPWAVNDSFTFSTVKNIEYTSKNPVKIIWSLLTGYDYDTDTAETWLTKTPQLDSTQSAANTDIDFPSFTTAISTLGSSFNLTGYISINENCSSAISDIITHFLGSIYTNEEGKIVVNTYTPSLGENSPREFSDSKKISFLEYKKSYEDIINSCTAKYKKTSSWAWSDGIETQDGTYTKTNSTSITTYGEKTFTIATKWISINNQAIQWVVDRIIDKFANPPTILEFITGTDALQAALGDIVQVTDTKSQINKKEVEVFKLSKDFSSKPTHIKVSGIDSLTAGLGWAFCGSSASESDYDWTVISPKDWTSIAVSSDGLKQTALAMNEQIFISADTGQSWNLKDYSRSWQGIAVSSDGTKQTAIDLSGYIYVSTDSGATWTAKDSTRNWVGIAMSDDGIKQTAVHNYGYIYISADSGNTWTAKDSIRAWGGIAMSANGTKQTAIIPMGQIYVSVDSGATWTAKDSARNWVGIAMSDDGIKQTAVVSNGKIYISTDSGDTWTAKDSNRDWRSVAMSADGVKQTATVYNGQIYVSVDSGATWTAKDSARNWLSVAMSSDGVKQTAVVRYGRIYFSVDSGDTWETRSSGVWEFSNNFEKQFAFASTTGGEGTSPDYYLW